MLWVPLGIKTFEKKNEIKKITKEKIWIISVLPTKIEDEIRTKEFCLYDWSIVGIQVDIERKETMMMMR